MKEKILNFIQQNSPDGGFLQSEQWRKFQEDWGRKAQNISVSDNNGELIAYANIIEHKLPIVGSYFYAPRGPVAEIFNFQFFPPSRDPAKAVAIFKQLEKFLNELISLAKKNDINWIRIEPANEEIIELIKENLPNGIKIKKSSVDMQPREILVMDISGDEGEILARMKPKTRYNIRLAEKKNVKVFTSREEKYIGGFCRLIEITAKRDKIKSHPENYYRRMLEMIPDDILKLYIAEFEGNIIAANLVLFFGSTATYMHGASASAYRNVMAPYLLQWQQIKDAKKTGCAKYDFGGVKTEHHPGPLLVKERETSWNGITKFKIGFAPDIETIKFPGSWDIVLNSNKYNLYRILQKVKRIF